jgi:hypothetical protein
MLYVHTCGRCYDHNFLRSSTIFGKKWRFYQKPLLWLNICIIKLVFEPKRPIFRLVFWRKYLQNHSIGPWLKMLSSFIFCLKSIAAFLKPLEFGSLELRRSVTRLGEFSPNGRLFSLSSFLKNYKSSPRLMLHFS